MAIASRGAGIYNVGGASNTLNLRWSQLQGTARNDEIVLNKKNIGGWASINMGAGEDTVTLAASGDYTLQLIGVETIKTTAVDTTLRLRSDATTSTDGSFTAITAMYGVQNITYTGALRDSTLSLGAAVDEAIFSTAGTTWRYEKVDGVVKVYDLNTGRAVTLDSTVEWLQIGDGSDGAGGAGPNVRVYVPGLSNNDVGGYSLAEEVTTIPFNFSSTSVSFTQLNNDTFGYMSVLGFVGANPFFSYGDKAPLGGGNPATINFVAQQSDILDGYLRTKFYNDINVPSTSYGPQSSAYRLILGTDNADSGGGMDQSAADSLIGRETGYLVYNADMQPGYAMYGFAGNDAITGGSDNDTIYGGIGDDTITGGRGLDQIYGEAGNDRIIMSVAAADIDAANGGADTDTLALTGAAAGAVVIDLSVAADADQLTSIAGAAQTSVQSNFESVDASAMTGGGISVTGSTAANTITGSAQADSILGGLGDDLIVGAAGVDTLDGGAGNDVYSYGSFAEFYSSGTLVDSISDTAGVNDTVKVTGAITLAGAASLAGVSGVEILQQVSGLASNITLTTDAQLGSFRTFDYALTNGANTAIFNGVTNALSLTISGGSGAEALGGGAGADTISGGSGDDNIQGYGGADSLSGGIGNDVFYYQTNSVGANESISGDVGTDTIYVQFSTDFTNLATATILNAGLVEQVLITSGQTATFTGAQLHNQAIAVNATTNAAATLTINVATGGTVNLSSLTFGAFGQVASLTNDAFTSGTDVIEINGVAGGETITGTSIADIITGGAGVDNINGGAGVDAIDAGTDYDVITGGTGADIFVFNAAAGSSTSGPTFSTNYDEITDFEVGDWLQLTNVNEVVSGEQAAVDTAISALPGSPTDSQVFGAMAFANATDAAVVFAVIGGNTYVLFERTGAGIGVAADDVSIKLTGYTAPALSLASDFIA